MTFGRITPFLVAAALPLVAQAPQTPLDPARATELSAPVVDVPVIKVGDFYFVDVLVNGKPLRFTIETGASFFVIGTRAAEALGLPMDTVTPARGPSREPAPVARIATLAMGGATLDGVTAFVSPMFDGSAFFGDGIISLPALHDVLATLDFGAKRLRLERGALPTPNGRDVVAIAGKDRGARIDVPIDVGGV